MKNKNLKKEKGFTLVELLVSIAIFSLVLVVMLGAIISIMDANRKARSLSLVMNNLDLSIESMTRSIKTGYYRDSGDNWIEVKDQYGEIVKYEFNQEEGSIDRIKGEGLGAKTVRITSPEIEVQDFLIDEFQVATGQQPRFVMRIKGLANVGGKISSEFNIQTTVSQRNLNIPTNN